MNWDREENRSTDYFFLKKRNRDRYVILMGHDVCFPKYVRERLYLHIIGILKNREGRATCLEKELLFAIYSSFSFCQHN